uniref:Uncharacterized protein n=1 Tax=Arundo donax TaxID=35708 RepID=A0A0A8YPA5_ARUDO
MFSTTRILKLHLEQLNPDGQFPLIVTLHEEYASALSRAC